MSKSELKRLAIQQAPAPDPMRIGPSSGFHNISTLTACPWAAPAEPYGYCVYFPDEQRQEWCNDLDELVDDLTNCRHEITPLYAHPAEPAPSATVDEVMAQIEFYGQNYHARFAPEKRVALRAAIEQIVSLNTTLAGMVASAEEQRDRQARRAEHAERERDAERDGRDAMDSAARCNHAAYEKERDARERAEQEAAANKRMAALAISKTRSGITNATNSKLR